MCLNIGVNVIPTTFPFFLTVHPPKIISNPESMSVAARAGATFTVEATGDELQFQWQKDGKDIDKNESRLQCSQTNNTSTLHIQHVKKSDQGHYKCLVKNLIEENEKTSHDAELTVREFVCTVVSLVYTCCMS